MSAAELVARALAAGFRVTPAGVVRLVPGAEMPGDLLAALKAGRAAVLDHLRRHQCGPCGRLTECAADRDRLAGPNPWCDRADCPRRRKG